MVTISGYTTVEQLYLGSRTAVYRALQNSTQQPVVIKVLRREYPSFSELVQFRNQYSVAKHLSSPGIIQPLGLEPMGKGFALVMEDWGGIDLGRYIQQHPLELAEVLAIAIQLADILHDLVQHRVVHKDIKPANIVIHPETKQVKLIDFSIASLLPKETQEIQSPNALEGTLSYLAPEQTGRMNRGVDYRTDFYALGVTLYQLLAGTLPFTADDALELVHCHIARLPKPVEHVNTAVPAMVGAIVAKLMAKNAEDRYQNALGLKHDLQQCLAQWQETGAIAPFALGQRDLSDRFIIPEKLYGRTAEVQTLLAAFDRVTQGTSELILVAGFSGIGKTAVVNEVHKPITRQQGYFIKGKYDQFNRNIPFSAFVQAFRDLMRHLLSESDEQLVQWRHRILSAVGDNGQVLVEVIPELEQIIGKQPPTAEISGSSAQNRFNLLFQKFIAVFATQQHPLVMFLDDLQWADSASLNLMQVLLVGQKTGHLLMIGAYRDNEVFSAHPLMLTLDEIAKAGATLNTLTLAPLSQSDISHLIAETLSCELAQALPLSKLAYQKTQGNPFFTTQFLKTLHQEGFITFDPDDGCWQSDLAGVETSTMTDDVVEFMARQLQKLPPETQQMLKLAACVGAQFDLETLAIVSQQPAAQVAVELWQALQEGLILPNTEVYKFYHLSPEEWASEVGSQSLDLKQALNCTYRFLHDRVQQAAHSLIPDNQKQATHLKIGRLLLNNASETEKDDKLFDIVNHLNAGLDLITSPEERNQLAQLNLLAGQKACSSTAYAAATQHFGIGIRLLETESWQNQYHLTLSLYEAAVEAEYLNINFAKAQTLANVVLQHTTNLCDRVKIYELQIQMYMAQAEMPKALEAGMSALDLVGVDLTQAPSLLEIQLPTMAEIESMPIMKEPNQLAIQRILMALFPSAYTTQPELLPPMVTTMIALSLEHGQASVTAIGYIYYGLLLGGLEEHLLDTGYYSGLLALKIVEKFSAKELECRVNNLFNSFIKPWKQAIRDTIEPLARASQIGFETGDIEYASYATAHGCTHYFLTGEPLEEVQKKQALALDILLKTNQEHALYNTKVWQQLVSNLLGEATTLLQLTGKYFDEVELLPVFCAGNDRTLPFATYIAKSILNYLFEDHSAAALYAAQATDYLGAVPGFITVSIHNFYYSLALLAQCSESLRVENSDDEASQAKIASALQQVEVNQTHMKVWLTDAPANFEHKYNLVEAEKAKLLKDWSLAIHLYDQAIAGAKANAFTQEEALANELAAKFYLEWGKVRIAQEYMAQAYYGYARWDAKAKVEDLERCYPDLLAPILQQTHPSLSIFETVFATGKATFTSSASSVSSALVSLDLATILKASQTLSSEIELEKLLASLLSIVLENAGADKCVLMLLRDDRLLIKGSIIAGSKPVVFQRIPVEESQDIPLKVIYKVKHEGQTVVLLNANADVVLASDPYIMHRQPKSLLCSPILHQGKLLGILYLENSLVPGAFTADRVELLNLLCAQAAISLENAQLYERSQQHSQQLERSLRELSIAESSLRASQQRLQLLVQQTPLAIIEWDTNQQITSWNPAAERIFGYTQEEVLDRHSQFLMSEIQAQIENNSSGLLLHQDSTFNVNENITKDGKSIFCAWYNSPLVNEIGEFIGVTSLVDDITDRKMAELKLRQQAEELEAALKNLKQAQLQMVQNEKMATLGNLVAGVAHEVNNPVGFLNGSINNAKDYAQALFEHLEVYQKHLPPTQPVQDHAEEIDLEFLLKDLPKLLDSMTGATNRIQSISTSLRTFSRADTEYKVRANLHEGIDSTILILKYRLKADEFRPAIEVVKEYGNLPLITCFPGQLNQVFMNILANAIDIFDEAVQKTTVQDLGHTPQQITIQTVSLPEQNAVEVHICDNGRGMSEEVSARVFDHLFTTKDVGKGTGLGLAIARQIVVEKHGGRLEVQSKLGQGTEFCIWLPTSVVS
uniref:AAA family ATPase n=1 Tax=Oculatella sp. LEGE 06141 TaxID=1828648 RepID=UPI0030D7BDB2